MDCIWSVYSIYTRGVLLSNDDFSFFLHSFKVDIPRLWKNCEKNNFFQYRSLIFVSIDYMKYISDVSMGDFMSNDDFLVFLPYI